MGHVSGHLCVCIFVMWVMCLGIYVHVYICDVGHVSGYLCVYSYLFVMCVMDVGIYVCLYFL